MELTYCVGVWFHSLLVCCHLRRRWWMYGILQKVQVKPCIMNVLFQEVEAVEIQGQPWEAEEAEADHDSNLQYSAFSPAPRESTYLKDFFP